MTHSRGRTPVPRLQAVSMSRAGRGQLGHPANWTHLNNLSRVITFQQGSVSLPGRWLSCLVHCPRHQKVTGSIPSQGSYLGCGFPPWSGHTQETTSRCLSFSLSLFLSLKSIKNPWLKIKNIFFNNYISCCREKKDQPDLVPPVLSHLSQCCGSPPAGRSCRGQIPSQQEDPRT